MLGLQNARAESESGWVGRIYMQHHVRDWEEYVIEVSEWEKYEESNRK